MTFDERVLDFDLGLADPDGKCKLCLEKNKEVPSRSDVVIAGRNCNPGIFQRVAYVWSRDCRGNYVLLVDRIARPLRKEQKYGTEAVKGVRCRIEYTKLGRVRVLSFCFSISCVGFLAVCLSKTVSGFFWCGDAVRADVGAAGSVLFLAGCGWSEIFPPFFCSFFLFFMKIFFLK